MKTSGKKRIYLILVGVLLATIGLWVYSTVEPFETWAYAVFAFIALAIGLSLFFVSAEVKSEKAGLPANDEFTKRIKEKAAATAFSISIFMWTFGAMFLVDSGVRADLVIGLGILGMGLIFLVSWFYYSRTGIEDEHQD